MKSRQWFGLIVVLPASTFDHLEFRQGGELKHGGLTWYRCADGTVSTSIPLIGMREDGKLINDMNYPEDLVRPVVKRAWAEWLRETAERKAAGIKKAVSTRKRNRENLAHDLARKWADGQRIFGPSDVCLLCKRALTDDESVRRGIGPECWQGMVNAEGRMSQAREDAAA